MSDEYVPLPQEIIDAEVPCSCGADHPPHVKKLMEDLKRIVDAYNDLEKKHTALAELKGLCLCPLHFGDCDYCDDGKCMSPDI